MKIYGLREVGGVEERGSISRRREGRKGQEEDNIHSCALQNWESNESEQGISTISFIVFQRALVLPKDPDKSATLFLFFSSPQKFMTTLLLNNLRKRQSYNFLT